MKKALILLLVQSLLLADSGYSAVMSQLAPPSLADVKRNSESNRLFALINEGNNIVKHPLYKLLKKETKESDSEKLENWVYLLIAHAHLVKDRLAELKEAIEDFKNESVRVDVTNYFSVILNYERLISYGASWDSYYAVAEMVKQGYLIADNPEYFIPGEIRVHETIFRPDSRMKKKDYDMLGEYVEDLSEIIEVDCAGLLLDLFEENIPQEMKREIILALLAGTEDEKNFENIYDKVITEGDIQFTLPDDSNSRILSTVWSHYIAQGVRQKNRLLHPYLRAFLIRHLYASRQHFKTHVDALLDYKGNHDEIFKIYDSLRESFINGIGDYSYSELFEILQYAINGYVESTMFKDANIRILEEFNISLEAPDAVSQLRVKLDELEKQIAVYKQNARENREILKRTALSVNGIREILIGKVIVDKIKNVKDMKELKNVLDKLDRNPEQIGSQFLEDKGVKNYFSKLFALIFPERGDYFEKDRKILNSLSIYFGEGANTGKILELELIPVKGILGAIAIDTGSDCGNGQLMKRTFFTNSGLYLIREKKSPEIPRGYISLYEFKGEYNKGLHGTFLMIDAANPTTDLNINGPEFLTRIQEHCRRMLEKAEGRILAVRSSKTPGLFSNRGSISTAYEGFEEENVEFDISTADISSALQRRDFVKDEDSQIQALRLGRYLYALFEVFFLNNISEENEFDLSFFSGKKEDDFSGFLEFVLEEVPAFFWNDDMREVIELTRRLLTIMESSSVEEYNHNVNIIFSRLQSIKIDYSNRPQEGHQAKSETEKEEKVNHVSETFANVRASFDPSRFHKLDYDTNYQYLWELLEKLGVDMLFLGHLDKLKDAYAPHVYDAQMPLFMDDIDNKNLDLPELSKTEDITKFIKNASIIENRVGDLIKPLFGFSYSVWITLGLTDIYDDLFKDKNLGKLTTPERSPMIFNLMNWLISKRAFDEGKYTRTILNGIHQELEERPSYFKFEFQSQPVDSKSFALYQEITTSQ